MSALEGFLSGLVEGASFVAFLAVALIVGNAASFAKWLRSKWESFTDLPPTTTVPRMLDEVERGRR